MRYDAAIVGCGPAGLSAALNLKLHSKSVLWLGRKSMSDNIARSELIRNYPGFSQITGEELNARFAAQAQAMQLQITDARVTNVMPAGDFYMLLADNEVYEAKTVLLSIGIAQAGRFAGEREFLGRGVSYCVTCDAFLYKGKTVSVYCERKEYEHEIMDLAAVAQTVYLYVPYKDCTVTAANVIRLQAPVKEVLGEDRVSALRLRTGTCVQTEGFFCLRDSVAADSLVAGLAMDGAHIQTGRGMETNLPGCFAAGDCTGRPYQIAKAVGEGNMAAHSMLLYLSRN